MEIHRLDILDNKEKGKKKSISSNDKSKDSEQLQEKWKATREGYS